MNGFVLKWLRKQKMNFSVNLTMDRIYLLDELVEKGEYKNRSQAIAAAVDLLLKKHYPDYKTDAEERLSAYFGNFVRADKLAEEADAE